jgi:hypothetical protein
MISLQAAEIDPNVVKPGWIALLIVLALGAATALLWLSMRKQLKRIDVDRDGADDPAPSGDPASPDSSPSPDGDAAPTVSEQTQTPSDAREHSEH